MVILQFIMGFIMGIYLMQIVSGHLATKKVMAALKGEGSLQVMPQDHNHKNRLDDNSG
jgi:hypothetical protein